MAFLAPEILSAGVRIPDFFHAFWSPSQFVLRHSAEIPHAPRTATAGVALTQERTLGKAIDDVGIALQIKDKLFTLSDDLFIRVKIKSVEGRVLLTGSVPTPEDRVKVSKIVWQIQGVNEVYNELEVRDRSKLIDFFTDLRISNELRLKILKNKEISTINYSVETINKVIYLTGIAQNQNELDLVAEEARNIKGVKKVISYVILKNDKRRLQKN